MNPLNLLLSLVIAKNKENEYHVNDLKSLQNTALLSGMISTNPIFSYLLIDNKAKELQTDITTENSVPIAVELPTSSQVPAIPIKLESTSIELLKRLETLKSEIISTVTLNIDKVISEKIDAKFLKSNDPKIQELSESTRNYIASEAIISLNNLNKDYNFICDQVNKNKLSKVDLETIAKLKTTFFDKNYIEEAIKIFESKIFDKYYFDNITLIISIQSKISDIKYKLENSVQAANTIETKTVETKVEFPKSTIAKKEPLKK